MEVLEQSRLVAIADLARGMVGQLISSCWRAGECAKDWMSNNKTKTETKPKHTRQKTPPRTREDIQQTKWNRENYASELEKPSEHSVPLYDDIVKFRK